MSATASGQYRGGVQITRRSVLALAGVALVTSCAQDVPGPSPSTTGTSGSSPSRSSSSPSAVPKLTQVGVSRRVVNALRAEAGDHPVIKVDLTESSAELSVLVDGSPRTYAWRDGVITEVPSEIAYVGQTSFDPSGFAFDDLSQLFGIAGALSGSLSNQQLHIVDHNEGDVLMTVTTRPESRPVFFRADASPIHELDFSSLAGVREGLIDVMGDRTQLAALGLDPGQGMWADAPHPTEPGVMVRRIRPSKLPAFQSQRKEDAPERVFSPVDVRDEVLVKLMKDLPPKLGKDPGSPIRWTIDMRHELPEPTITVDVGGQTVVTDLSGLDITDTVS